LPREIAVGTSREWFAEARLAQYPLWKLEPGAPDGWLVVGGRGAGKTRLGAEWVNALARGLPPFCPDGVGRYGAIALVGETLADVREVMIEGPSGIRQVARGGRPRFEPSRRRLVWEASGAVAQMFSSEDPESLRGPQFDAAWCDELAKWKNLEATWDMLQFGLRLGQRPQVLVTTTPRPVALLKRLMADKAFHLTRMATAENAENLAPGFVAAVEARYGGTRLGRQELAGEMVEDRADALWNRAGLEKTVSVEPASLARIVVAVDPPATGRRSSAACGIVVAGLTADGLGVVLEDGTVEAAAPSVWAGRAVALYHRWEADRIVAEVNQGGDMVAEVIRSVDASVPVSAVRASRGKWLRAEPVAALYEQGKVRHAARMAALEDEMCDFGADGLSGGRSPDRVDALVWALTDLMLKRAGSPRVRTIGQ
jgi:phage terminase large subunit-like protein